MILIDTSSNLPNYLDRIEMAKAGARALLDTLSYRDYISVIPYNEYADLTVSAGQMFQATIANKLNITRIIDLVEAPAAGKLANVGSAIRSALELLAAGRQAGRSSNCAQTIVIFGSGENDITESNTNDLLNESPEVVLFVNLITPPGSGTPRTLLSSELTCISKGILRLSTTVEEVQAFPREYNNYFSSLLVSPVARWSEHYEDAFGQGRIVSGSMPVYEGSDLKGMLVIDVPLRNFTVDGNATPTEVNNFFLSSQTCTPLRQRSDEQAAVVRRVRGDACTHSTTLEGETLTATRLMPLFVFISIVMILIGVAIPFILLHKLKGKDSQRAVDQVSLRLLVLSLAFLVLWIVALALFWAGVYKDIVVKHHFEAVESVIERHTPNPFRCCDIVNCRCENYVGLKCPYSYAYLIEGPCDNDYYCCRERCYECSCSRDSNGHESCSTCCECIESVSHQRCDVACGTCYRPTLDVSYIYRETSLVTRTVGFCGRDNTACRDRMFRENPIGERRVAYVNPEQPSDLRQDVGIRARYLAPFIVFAVFATIVWGIMVFVGVDSRRLTNPQKKGRYGKDDM